jgi:hypothetical protein
MRSVLIVIVLVISSCTEEHFSGEFDTINISDAVKFSISNSCQQIEKSGLAAKRNYFSGEINFYWLLNNTPDPTQDYTTYFKTWDAQYKLLKYEIKKEDIQVAPICNDRASFYYKLNIVYEQRNSKDTIRNTFLEAGVMMKEKESNNWKYLNGLTTLLSGGGNDQVNLPEKDQAMLSKK